MSAVVRPRGHWEAIDLGIRLVRPYYARMLLTSFLLTAPIFLVIHLLLWNHLWFAPIALWWLKPLWERVHLHLLSRRLFGEAPTTRETLGTFPGYGFREWLPWLTIRRLSPTRSLDLPITQLEGLSGKQRRARLELLHRGSTSTGALWLTFVCANLEGFLYVSVAISAWYAAPGHLDSGLGYWFAGEDVAGRWDVVLQDALVHGVSLLVAPFYVGGGFALYINRRTILEGWDLEIAFRRIAKRVRQLSPHRAARSGSAGRASLLATLLLPALLLPLAFAASPTRAADSTSRLSPQRAHASIESVLAGEAFHQKQTTQVPRFMLDWELSAEEDPDDRPPVWLRALLQSIASAGEVILIALALAAVGYVVYRARGAATGQPRRRSRASVAVPSVLLGLDVSPESLPDEVAGAVLALWQRGATREALALLYRAALSELAHFHAVVFRAGFTESDCLSAVSLAVSRERAEFFRELTRTWEELAYGHRSVPTSAVVSLCAAWERVFDGADVAEHPGDANPSHAEAGGAGPND